MRSTQRMNRRSGTCGYLGEWHTHAEPVPSPSPIDLDDWTKRLAHDVVDADQVFFVIVGQQEMACWEGVRATGQIFKLEPAA